MHNLEKYSVCFQASGCKRPFEFLNDRYGLEHQLGTYDTYKCGDCGFIAEGYKRGDPHLISHILKGNGGCKYILAKFQDRKGQLKTILGTNRYQRGYIALPNMLHATHGYIQIDDTQYCVFCMSPSSERHDDTCSKMMLSLKLMLNLQFWDVEFYEEKCPLFSSNKPGDDIKTSTTIPSILKILPRPSQDFSVLGEPTNMYHIPGTPDTHKCRSCKLKLNNFVMGDTLLGRHVYSTYQDSDFLCPYLKERYCGQKEKAELILGYERYRRGYVAFPDFINRSVRGFMVVDGVERCIICTADHCTTAAEHKKNCLMISLKLLHKLEYSQFIH